jgi:hypothetical protein
MTAHWLVIEKLVVELGSVCAAHYETREVAGSAAATESRVAEAVGQATEAVTAVLRNPQDDDDVAVRTAWEAIARAQDRIRGLKATVDKSRALREAAVTLQDRSLRLRRPRKDRS